MKFVFDVAKRTISEDRGFRSIEDWKVENGIVRIPMLNVVFTNISKESISETLREVNFTIYVNKIVGKIIFDISAEMCIESDIGNHNLKFDKKELSSLSLPFLLNGIKTCSVKGVIDTKALYQWLVVILPILNSKLGEDMEFSRAYHLTVLFEDLASRFLPTNRSIPTKSYWEKSDMFIYTTKERSLNYMDSIYDYTVDLWDIKNNEFKLFIERNTLEQRKGKLEITRTLLVITLDALGVDFFLSERTGELKDMEITDIDFNNSNSVLEYTEKLFKEINKNGTRCCLVKFLPVMEQQPYGIEMEIARVRNHYKFKPGIVQPEIMQPGINPLHRYNVNPAHKEFPNYDHIYTELNPNIGSRIDVERVINEDYIKREDAEEDAVTTNENVTVDNQSLQTVLTNYILDKYNNKKYWDTRIIRNYIIDTGRKNISDEEKEFIRVNSPKIYKEFFEGED